MKPNGRAYNRYKSKMKALRKRRLSEKIYQSSFYDNLHQYSKNKIHCSCPMCSAKTRNKGKRRYKDGNYARHLNYKISDLKRQISMDDEAFDYDGSFGANVKRKNE